MNTHMELITIDQLAALIHKSPRTVAQDVSRAPSRLPPTVRVGRRVLFRRSDVEQWIVQHVVAPPRPRGRPRKTEAAVGSAGAK